MISSSNIAAQPGSIFSKTLVSPTNHPGFAAGYKAEKSEMAVPVVSTQAEQKPASNAVDATAKNLSIEQTRSFDLTHMTPKENYTLAVNLLESHTVSLSSYVQMMAIGLNQQYPPGQQVDKTDPNNAPFDLLNEVALIASGEHQYFTSGNASDRDEASSLLDLLSSLPQTMRRIQHSTIDVRV